MLWYTNSCYRGPVWGVCLNGSTTPYCADGQYIFMKEVYTHEPEIRYR